MIHFKVDHIDYMAKELVAGWAPGEVEVSSKLDDRTVMSRTFDSKADAMVYIRATKMDHGKWLANITLSKVIETEENIDD